MPPPPAGRGAPTDEQLAAVDAFRIVVPRIAHPRGVVPDSAGRTRGCDRRLAGGARRGHRHRRVPRRNGGDARGAGPGCGRRERPAAGRGAPVGGCRLLGHAGSRRRFRRRRRGSPALSLAIKGFTHMDQATVAEPVDLTSGLRQHGRRPQCKGAIEVRRGDRDRPPDLPRFGALPASSIRSGPI